MKTLATTWGITIIATGMTITTTAIKGLSPMLCASWTLCGVCIGLSAANTAIKAAKRA